MQPDDPDYWLKVRRARWSTVSPPPQWPKGVRPISTSGLGLFGIDESRGTLHWDGAELQIKNKVSLRWIELTLAALATIAVVVSTTVQLLEYLAT